MNWAPSHQHAAPTLAIVGSYIGGKSIETPTVVVEVVLVVGPVVCPLALAHTVITAANALSDPTNVRIIRMGPPKHQFSMANDKVGSGHGKAGRYSSQR